MENTIQKTVNNFVDSESSTVSNDKASGSTTMLKRRRPPRIKRVVTKKAKADDSVALLGSVGSDSSGDEDSIQRRRQCVKVAEWEKEVGAWDDIPSSLFPNDNGGDNGHTNNSSINLNCSSSNNNGIHNKGKNSNNINNKNNSNGGANCCERGEKNKCGTVDISSDHSAFTNDADKFTFVSDKKMRRNRLPTKVHVSDPTVYKYPVILQDDGAGTDCYKNYGIDTNRLWTKA